jgi:hypothetical protein
MWLKSAAPELLKGLTKIESDQASDKKLLRKSLIDSGKAIGTLLETSFENGGKVKGFKPHATAFLGYLISHESHHRGQIALSLKQSGKPLDKRSLMGSGSGALDRCEILQQEKRCQDCQHDTDTCNEIPCR